MNDGPTEQEMEAMRGCATEPNFDIFVRELGGHKVSDLHPNPAFENADYVFHDQKVIIELKILETEIGSTHQFREKARILEAKVVKKHGHSLPFHPQGMADFLMGFIGLFRAPLARIVKKANRQIRSTKTNLGYEDYCGVFLVVNDALRELPPRFVMLTINRILMGAHSSIDVFIYVTNHYVILPDDEYGRLLWYPIYSGREPDSLPDFVNWLGGKWTDYCARYGLPNDDPRKTEDITTIIGSRAAGSKFPLT